MCAELAALRLYRAWCADGASGVNAVLATVPLDVSDPGDAVPPPVGLIVEETTTPWAALGRIPDEVVQAHGCVLVFNVVGDTEFAARTVDAVRGDAIQIAARVATLSARTAGATITADTDRVVADLYRYLHAVRRVIDARFAAREGTTAELARAGATLEEPPTISRGAVVPDPDTPNVVVGALLITQPVSFPWARAAL